MDQNYQLLHKELQEQGLFVNPLLSYSGSYFFQNFDCAFHQYDPKKDILWLNAKVQNGKNLYEEFVNKYFYDVLDLDIPKSLRQAFYPVIESDLSKDGKGRYLHFNYVPSLWNILEDVSLIPTIPIDEVELAKYVKKHLIQKRNQMIDVIQNWEKSPYYEEVKQRFDFHNMEMTPILLDRQREVFTKLIFIVKGMDESFFNQRIHPEIFFSCIDLDKFYLLASKCVFDYTLRTLQIENNYHKSLVEAFNYLQVVQDLKIPNYNPVIRYYNEKTKKIESYSFKDLKHDLTTFLAKYPNIQFFLVPTAEIETLGIERDAKQLETYTDTILQSKKEDISCGWEIIRKGERKEKETKEPVHPRFQTPKEKDFYLSFMKRKLFFESSNYLCRIVGINNFNGYQGYIYPSGMVVFEKLYEDVEAGKISKKSNATYIMNLDNFVDFSKLTKPEIMKFIKNTANPQICRKNHNETWEERMRSMMEGKGYTEEIEKKIEALISSNVKRNAK